MPLSLTASMAETMANCAKRSRRRAVLLSMDFSGSQVLDLAAEFGLEGGGVEQVDETDAAAAGAECLPEVRDVRAAERIDRAQTGDDDATRHFLAISRSM